MSGHEPTPGGTAEVGVAETPRFMQAIEEVTEYLGKISRAHGELSRMAQDFDFVLAEDGLASVRGLAAARLRTALDESEAPEPIVAIYSALYGDVINEELSRGK